MRLVENWKRSHRKYSVQAMAFAATTVAAWENIPADLKTALPTCAAKVVGYFVVLLLCLGIAGSMVDQGDVTEPKP